MKPNPIDEAWLRHSGAVLAVSSVWSFVVFCWVAWVLWLGEFELNDKQLVTRKDNPGVFWGVECGAMFAGGIVMAHALWNRSRARSRTPSDD
jgi:hypothetical protein